MIILATGLPGNFKTLSVVKAIRDEYKDRKVYTNIPFTDVGKAQMPWVEVVDNETLANWQDLPDGSFLVIDEVQKIWPTRSSARAVPVGVSSLAEHRHRGFDFIIITQDTGLLDAWVRKFVQRHYHFDRPFGGPFAYHYIYEGCLEKPADQTKSQSFIGEAKKIFPDKSIYPLYDSATIHTVKFKLPLKVKLAIGFVVLCLCAIWYGGSNFYHRFVKQDVDLKGKAVAVSANTPLPSQVKSDTSNAVLSADDFRRALKVSKDCVVSGAFRSAASERIMIYCSDGGFYDLADLRWMGGYDYDAVRRQVKLHTGPIIQPGFINRDVGKIGASEAMK
jgi:zona occludens toxin